MNGLFDLGNGYVGYSNFRGFNLIFSSIISNLFLIFSVICLENGYEDYDFLDFVLRYIN